MEMLDVIIRDPRWELLDLPKLGRAAVGATLTHLNLDPAICEASILACDDAHIATLNADFRDKPTATNVLSWPAQERGAPVNGDPPVHPAAGPGGMVELGDIAISYDTCVSEAAVANKPISAHVTHLIVHGTLHLLGYDHIRDLDGDVMERIEVEILGKLGYNDPYCNDAAHIAAIIRSQD